MPTGAQIRMARAAVRLSVRELAAEARGSPTTITRVETDGSSNASTLAALGRAWEAAGFESLPDTGVRLRVTQLEPPARSDPGGPAKPARAEAAPRAKKPPAEPKAKPAPSSKLDQIRALREQGAR